MSYGEQINLGLYNIAQARSGEEAAERYVDYHHLMMDMPPIETAHLIEAAKVGGGSLKYEVDDLWSKKVRTQTPLSPYRPHNYGNYFRGSGLVAVADIHGTIVGLSDGPLSGTEQDLVQDKYPNYRNYVPIFLGSAAMLWVMGERGRSFDDQDSYARRGEVLLEAGIIKEGETHHLGYLISPNSGLLAGASGVLPSEAVRKDFEWFFNEANEEDKAKGLYEWPYDHAAGYHDVIACREAVSLVNRQRNTPRAFDFAAEAYDLRELGQDIH